MKAPNVSVLCRFSGERFDVIIDTRNKPVSTYWILVQGVPTCANQNAFQIAALKYAGSPLGDMSRTSIGPKALPRGKVRKFSL